MVRKVWMVLLSIFLVLYGLLRVSNFDLVWSQYVLGALAIATAIFLLLDLRKVA